MAGKNCTGTFPQRYSLPCASGTLTFPQAPGLIFGNEGAASRYNSGFAGRNASASALSLPRLNFEDSDSGLRLRRFINGGAAGAAP